MYEAIKGTLTEKDPAKAIVETGGIFYRCAISLNTYTKLCPIGSAVFLFLSQVIREDSNTLYAFLTKEERDLFETLIGLSGIGPKTAIAITGHMEISLFQKAIAAADVRILSKIPGIGKKTAERLVIELRDKWKKFHQIDSSASTITNDAINALIHLGYNPLVAQQAVQSALAGKKDAVDLGPLITAALQKI